MLSYKHLLRLMDGQIMNWLGEVQLDDNATLFNIGIYGEKECR